MPRRPVPSSRREQRFDLGCANEIVGRDAVDRVRRIGDAAAVEVDRKIRMVVLAVGNPGGRVDEGKSLVIIRELERLHDFALLEAPAGKDRKIGADIAFGKRAQAAGIGAASGGERFQVWLIYWGRYL